MIERLGIDLTIVEGDGIDAPIGKAAHYPGTGWPGGGTNIYIYGHAQEGMFLSLWDAKKGDEVVLDARGRHEANVRRRQGPPQGPVGRARVPRSHAQGAADPPDVHVVPPDLAPLHRHRLPGAVTAADHDQRGRHPPTRRRRRSARRRRRVTVLAGTGTRRRSLLVVAAGAPGHLQRYLPALDEARALRTDLEAMASSAQDAGLELDRPTLDGLNADLAAARGRLDRLDDLLANDPLVGARAGPPADRRDVRGADAVVGAAGDLFDAAEDGLAIGRPVRRDQGGPGGRSRRRPPRWPSSWS